MTVKEIEERSGMTRANIRFYETEGLLAPVRGANGYRDYSEKDLEVLLKIKLLRALRVSLEDIKALQSGDKELEDTLEMHLKCLAVEQKELEKSQEVCQKIYEDGAKYNTLNAQRYLEYMERNLKEDSVIGGNAQWEEDVVPKVVMPWRRFFARSLDWTLYGMVWDLFLLLVCNVNVLESNTTMSIVGSIMGIVLMLLLEPVFLMVFGTTPGKWLLGIYVTDLEGEKPGYQESLRRTLQVLWYGLGAYIPVYYWIRLYKSYHICVESRDQEWEYHTNVCLKDEAWWRVIAYVAGYGCLMGVVTLAVFMVRMPKHTGKISVAEFCENYNRLADFYNMNEGTELNEQGVWVDKEKVSSNMVIHVVDNHESPKFRFWEENGRMTGLCFEEVYSYGDESADETSYFGMIQFYRKEMILAVLAFVQAQEEYSVFSNELSDVVEYIANAGHEDFSFWVSGVKITYDIKYYGYENMGQGFLVKLDEGNEAKCSMRFVMELSEE